LLHGKTISPPWGAGTISACGGRYLAAQDDIHAARGLQARYPSERSEDIVIRWAVASFFPIIGKIKGFASWENDIPALGAGTISACGGRYLACGKTISTLRVDSGKISSERSEDIVIRWAVASFFPIIGKIKGFAI